MPYTEPEPTQPQLTEITASVSTGGWMQLVEFKLRGDWHYSQSRKWTIPSDWTEEDVANFQAEETQKLKDELHDIAQIEVDALYEQRAVLNEKE